MTVDIRAQLRALPMGTVFTSSDVPTPGVTYTVVEDEFGNRRYRGNPSNVQHSETAWSEPTRITVVSVPERFLPTTPSVKQTIRDFAKAQGLDEAAALRAFNRWYTQELLEAREEGQEIAEDAHAATSAYIVFTGPHEVTRSYEEAQDRLNELATQGIDATVVVGAYDPLDGEAIGLSSVTETVTTLRASKAIRLG